MRLKCPDRPVELDVGKSRIPRFPTVGSSIGSFRLSGTDGSVFRLTIVEGRAEASHPAAAQSVHFNDTRCGGIAELRLVIVKARGLARDNAERERAAAAAKAWLVAQMEKKQAAPASDIQETPPAEPFAPERLAA